LNVILEVALVGAVGLQVDDLRDVPFFAGVAGYVQFQFASSVALAKVQHVQFWTEQTARIAAEHLELAALTGVTFVVGFSGVSQSNNDGVLVVFAVGVAAFDVTSDPLALQVAAAETAATASGATAASWGATSAAAAAGAAASASRAPIVSRGQGQTDEENQRQIGFHIYFLTLVSGIERDWLER